MELRLTRTEDLERVLELIGQAREFLRVQGVNQWQDGYPNRESILEDIVLEQSYVLEDGDRLVGTAVLAFGGEPTYEKIYGGQWNTGAQSGVIHRIATDAGSRGRGVATKLLLGLEEICARRGVFGLRVDTHRENKPMQGLLKKRGYRECGTIYLSDGVSERVAFDKIL